MGYNNIRRIKTKTKPKMTCGTGFKDPVYMRILKPFIFLFYLPWIIREEIDYRRKQKEQVKKE